MSLPGLFLTGTDTGIGKTIVAAAIARQLTREGHRVGVLKPVATGVQQDGETSRCEDAEALIEAVGGGVPLERVAPIRLAPPLAPPVAARLEGTTLEWSRVREAVAGALDWWAAQGADCVVVEGVGGFLCPLAEGATVADLAVALDLPLVIVARRGLGTLSHTLLSVEAARRRALRISGVVLNGSEPTSDPLAEATNADELVRHLGDVALLAELPHRSDREAFFDQDWLHGGAAGVNWFGWAQASRSLAGSIGLRQADPRS